MNAYVCGRCNWVVPFDCTCPRDEITQQQAANQAARRHREAAELAFAKAVLRRTGRKIA